MIEFFYIYKNLYFFFNNENRYLGKKILKIFSRFTEKNICKIGYNLSRKVSLEAMKNSAKRKKMKMR